MKGVDWEVAKESSVVIKTIRILTAVVFLSKFNKRYTLNEDIGLYVKYTSIVNNNKLHRNINVKT